MIAVGFQSSMIEATVSALRRSTARDEGATISHPALAVPLTM